MSGTWQATRYKIHVKSSKMSALMQAADRGNDRKPRTNKTNGHCKYEHK